MGLTPDVDYYIQVTNTDPDGVVGTNPEVIGPYHTDDDITPPAEATGFTVIDPNIGDQLNLAWTNPSDLDFAGVKLVRAEGATPPSANCGDGILAYTGTGASYNDTGLTRGTQYSYRLCAFDNAVPANYSTGVTGTGTPQDLTPPSDVTGLVAFRGDSQVALSWTNPVASDFMGVRVVRGIGSSPLTRGLKANWPMNEGSGAADSG